MPIGTLQGAAKIEILFAQAGYCIDRSKVAAAEAAAMTGGRFDAAFDDLQTEIDRMFGLVEACPPLSASRAPQS